MEKTEKPKKATIKKKEENDPQKAKLNALQQALGKIEKSFGRGAIMKLGDDSVENVEVIPSGSIGLNYALGVGGYPRGRIIEIFGPESSGKTTLAIHAIAEAQKAGGIAAIIDAEHAFDRFYAEKLGVDVNNLFISQPDNGDRRSRSPNSSYAPPPSTYSWSTPWPRSLPKARSKATWATAT